MAEMKYNPNFRLADYVGSAVDIATRKRFRQKIGRFYVGDDTQNLEHVFREIDIKELHRRGIDADVTSGIIVDCAPFFWNEVRTSRDKNKGFRTIIADSVGSVDNFVGYDLVQVMGGKIRNRYNSFLQNNGAIRGKPYNIETKVVRAQPKAVDPSLHYGRTKHIGSILNDLAILDKNDRRRKR